MFMMNAMKGFKCLNVVHGEMRSYTTHSPLVYKVGEKTVPEFGCGPIAVFDDLIYAMDFMRVNSDDQKNFEIWECEYEEYNYRTTSLIMNKDLNREFNKGYLMFWNNKGDTMTREEVPYGTVLAESVMITRKAI